MKTEYEHSLSSALNWNLPFVCYSLPGLSDFFMMKQNDCAITSMPDEISEGFCFYPFELSVSNSGVFLRADKKMQLSIDEIPSLEWKYSEFQFIEKGVAQLKYFSLVKKAKHYIQSNKAQKIVLSRKINIPVSLLSFSLNILREVRLAYPGSFVSLFHFPQIGTWLGATPEILLKSMANKMETMALAGTRKVSGNDIEWNKKEIAEHQFVSDYLVSSVLSLNGKGIQVYGPETIQAGPVEHLKTTLFFELDVEKHSLYTILKCLHPTPAVCGTPASAAFQWIKKNEGYNRKYYSGYLGPVLKNESNIFVNLRCMELTENQTNIYVGGGLTADSVPELEWEETKLKAETMLAVIQKFI